MTDEKSALSVKPRARQSSKEQEILAAARACFERYGIKKTSMEDIAREGRVSRATMYRLFANKDAIVEAIAIIETENVNRQLRAQLVGRASLEDTLVECMFLSTRIAHENKQIQILLDYPAAASMSARSTSKAHLRQRAMWGTLLEKAMERHSFAPDLEMDDLVRWLVQSQDMLLRMIEGQDLPDAELRWFIRRFVIFPLLDKNRPTG